MTLGELREKRVAVAMSAGFFGFFAHTGFMEALEESGISPCASSGASSGALVAAFVAAGLPVRELREILLGLKKEMFWDPDYRGLLSKKLGLGRGWSGLLKGDKLRALLGEHLPVRTFEECILPCCVTAADISAKKNRVFTEGSLVDAIHASLAVPGFFRAVRLEGCYYVDGGFITKAPVLDLYRLARPDVIVVHYLQSSRWNSGHNSFLVKKLAAKDISVLANYIGRHHEYKLECEFVESLGCKVIEVVSTPAAVSPGRLHNGALALRQGKERTLEALASPGT